MSPRGTKVAFRYAEALHSIFYTPVYAAITRGFCGREGLEVELYTCPPGVNSADLVAEGQADVAQSSPSAGLVAADKGQSAFPLHFAQINRRDGFFIVEQPERQGFQWKGLEEAELLPAVFAAQPWLSLQYCLRKQGVDPDKIRLTRYADLHQAEQAFRQGQGEFVHLPQPYAERLISEGAGRLAAAIGPIVGNVAFSSLTATRDRVLRQDPLLVSFTRAFARAQKWVQTAAPEELAEAVQPFFPETDREILTRAGTRYRDQGTWATQPLLSEEDFHVIQEIFYTGAAIQERHRYEEIVETAIARQVMEEGI
ncbi:MAG: ABC transporter substrate-binding protein [Candidatus Methylomirabilales bacterium]